MKQRYFLSFLFYFLPFLAYADPGSGSIEFVQNAGQWQGPFLYRATTGNSDIFLESNGFTYVVGAPDNYDKIHDLKENRVASPIKLNFHAYKVIFEGASTAEKVTGSKSQHHYYNYFLGSDSSKWKTGLHPYHAVDYKNLYNGVDMHIASENGQLKYDLLVQPGTDVSGIKIRFDGVDGLELSNNNLHILTHVGTAVEQQPYAYQVIDGERKEVPCRYKVKGTTVSYIFPKGYDETKLLVIDPTVVFATFTGSTSDNWGFTATYDNNENLYAGGFVAGGGYPFTTGFFQQTFAGGGKGDGNVNQFGQGFATDMAISKFDATGANMLFSTYLGGRDNEQPHSMIVDNSGNLVIVGRTYSNNFPVANAFDGTYNSGADTSADIVVIKLNASGTALVGSTYVGGSGNDGVNISSLWGSQGSLKHNYGDDARSEVIVDNFGNVYVAAATESTDFPTQSGTGAKGQQDGVVFKLNNNLSTLLWSTYIGGTGEDAAYVLSLDKAQAHVFVSGGTNSTGLGLGTVYQNSKAGDIDGFVARYLNSGSFPLERFTYIGTSSYDQSYGVQVDMDDNVYIMGQSNGNFPVINAGFSNAGANQFVMKLDKDLSAPIFSTVFGSVNATDPNISPVAFLVDTCQNIYISGWGGPTAGNGGNTSNMPVLLGTPAPALIKATTDGSDFYFIALARNATALLFAGYYGAVDVNGEHVDGGTSRFDKNGVIYQAICGGCGRPRTNPLPTTAGSWSQQNGSNNCNLAALKIAFNLGAVKAIAKATPDAVLCLGEAIQFQNTSSNATGYEWNFGDGSPVNTQPNPLYTYTAIGNYTVRMIALNPNACKVRDTFFLSIKVDTLRVKADFNIQSVKNCPPFKATFANSSTLSKTPGAANFTKFIWNFGDNTTFTGTNPPEHTYADSGTYTVTLVLIDTTACNAPDTISKKVTLTSDSVKAIFQVPELVCQNQIVYFTNQSLKSQTYLWKFGDGDTATAANPKHEYDSVATYTVTLVAFNPNSCNLVDSTKKSFTVKPGPIADFLHEPVTPVTNVPTSFTNISSRAISYSWSFGDNTGTTEHTPRPHQYKRTGEYVVCLAARNSEGCADTICKTVAADVYPLADVPTGFSPNGDGNNDILYVVGAGIETMNFRIYNRWGEKVFESAQQAVGWDGSYKSKQQEMDSYAFVLSITFIDGTTFYKKGNVTLIR